MRNLFSFLFWGGEGSFLHAVGAPEMERRISDDVCECGVLGRFQAVFVTVFSQQNIELVYLRPPMGVSEPIAPRPLRFQMKLMDESKQTAQERRALRLEQRKLRAEVIEQQAVSDGVILDGQNVRRRLECVCSRQTSWFLRNKTIDRSINQSVNQSVPLAFPPSVHALLAANHETFFLTTDQSGRALSLRFPVSSRPITITVKKDTYY